MNFKYSLAHISARVIRSGLGAVGKNFCEEVIRHLAVPPGQFEIEIDVPPMVEPDDDDLRITERILNAFRRAKEAQREGDPVYGPSTLWQGQLDNAYSSLSTGNVEEAAYFLANFGNWKKYTGIENSEMMHQLSGSRFTRDNLHAMFARLSNHWLVHESAGRGLEALSYPRHGNQSGALVNGTFIGIGSVFCEHYGTALSRLIDDVSHPVIAEIGGGWAKVMYFMSRQLKNDFRYIDFDLPEPLSCAAYYWLKTFPDRPTLLFGEGELNAEALRKYGQIFMPPSQIETLPDRSVNLFLNKNSLGEMSPVTARRYVEHVARTTDFFWHVNHEFFRNRFDDGSESLVAGEYALPAEQFQLLQRNLDWGATVLTGNYLPNEEIYIYLYRRRPVALTGA